MLMWLVVCMTAGVGQIANAAHFVGLVAGVAFGVLRFATVDDRGGERD